MNIIDLLYDEAAMAKEILEKKNPFLPRKSTWRNWKAISRVN